MNQQEFGELLSKIVLVKELSGAGGPGLRVIEFNGSPFYPISAYNSPDSLVRTRNGIDESVYVKPFNCIVKELAKQLHYYGNVNSFFATSKREINEHCVNLNDYRKDNNGVYIRTKSDYNNHGPKKGGPGKNDNTKGAHTMKNRKVTLTLITLKSGFALTLQITSASKDPIGWTRFCDPDLSKPEYDNITWTKDVESQNKHAVAAIDKMIQIEEDYAANKLEKDAAVEQMKDAYIEWVVAHLETNPEFVERRIPGLNCGEDLMSRYFEDDSEDEPEEEAEEATEEEKAE